jgi:hypothetical protein
VNPASGAVVVWDEPLRVTAVKSSAAGLLILSEPLDTSTEVPSEAKAAGAIDAKAHRVSRLAAIRDLIIIVKLLIEDNGLGLLIVW